MGYKNKQDRYQNQMQRWIKRKQQAIEYKGGKCEYCGFIGHQAAFDFHHLDPKIKRFNWTKMRLQTWDRVLEELDKCILLCANCHRVVHLNIP